MRWGRRPAPEDPDAVAVEAFLDAAATRLEARTARGAERPSVQDALWLCPCYSDEDPPVLLLCTTEQGEVLWSRVPIRSSALDLVAARRFTGAHTHPEQVLDWLHGRADDPGFDAPDAEDLEIANGLRDRLAGPAR